MQFARFAGVALIGAVLGCQAEQPAPAPEAPAEAAQPTTTAAESPLITGTPEGDIETWIADVKQGLEQVDASQTANRGEAHKRVLDLYVTRQEYMEMYYGPSGRMQPEPVLAEAVKMNETRFHELMRLTGSIPAAPADSVKAAIESLKQQLAVVEQNASKSAQRVRSVR